ncbi:MAG: type II toxin-antitoxin system RelE/ParE family toxin [Chromatiales bacterium]|nr:type II toxin-antitoxin system RelE/ParE family toxin [Gammaproteobacteria bacterium]MCP5352256.1 type II toxin-antitoxin system RelE/ParE family toxin [Chromatiales bacterium]
MSYELRFHVDAKREWDQLDTSIREPFKNKLRERLIEPHVPSARLRGFAGHAYKIKLTALGYRLVYTIDGETLTVIAVGKRERNAVYKSATKRK